SPYAPTSVRPRILPSALSSFAPARYTRRPKMYASPAPVSKRNSSSSSISAIGSRMLRLSVRDVFPTIKSSPGGPCATKSSHRMMLATVLPERTEPCQMLSRASASRIERRCLPVGRASVIISAPLLSQPLRQFTNRAAAPVVIVIFLPTLVEKHGKGHRQLLEFERFAEVVKHRASLLECFVDELDSLGPCVSDPGLGRLF